MKNFCIIVIAIMLSTALSFIAPADSSQEAEKSDQAAINTEGVHGFDFLVGEWRVHHRRLKPNSNEWVEFDGTLSNRQLMNGAANMEEHVLNSPFGTYRAIGIRSFDQKTGQWSIWWLDGRYPSVIGAPVQGKFENGIGSFYSEYPSNGKMLRGRFHWSEITKTSARWEQASSADNGKTWEPNWIMKLQRIS